MDLQVKTEAKGQGAAERDDMPPMSPRKTTALSQVDAGPFEQIKPADFRKDEKKVKEYQWRNVHYTTGGVSCVNRALWCFVCVFCQAFPLCTH